MLEASGIAHVLDVHVMTIEAFQLRAVNMWVKVNGWIKLPEGTEVQEERTSSKRGWQDWGQRGWWSADSGTNTQEGDGTNTQEGDGTTTQEGDRTAQQEGTTTQEDSDDGWIPEQKKKHQKMAYHGRDSSSSWWDWQQHGEWPGWIDYSESAKDPHAWIETWPEAHSDSAQYIAVPEEEMEAVLDKTTLGVENLQMASSSGPFAPGNSADLVLPAPSSGPCASASSADLVLPPNSGTIDPPISFEPNVSSALSESTSQSPGSGVHRKVPRAKRPQFQKRRSESRKQKH